VVRGRFQRVWGSGEGEKRRKDGRCRCIDVNLVVLLFGVRGCFFFDVML
jgi:hypothetical protein